jgi:hypothetical protein
MLLSSSLMFSHPGMIPTFASFPPPYFCLPSTLPSSPLWQMTLCLIAPPTNNLLCLGTPLLNPPLPIPTFCPVLQVLLCGGPMSSSPGAYLTLSLAVMPTGKDLRALLDSALVQPLALLLCLPLCPTFDHPPTPPTVILPSPQPGSNPLLGKQFLTSLIPPPMLLPMLQGLQCGEHPYLPLGTCRALPLAVVCSVAVPLWALQD